MKYRLLLFCVLAAAFTSCSRSEYDISEGFNKDITLFEKEISVPIGSIGPITIGSTLGGLSAIEGIGGLVAEYIKEDADGNLVLEDNGDIFRINIYELEKKLGDVSIAQTWNAGYQSGYVGGMASLLGYLGLKVSNQKLTVSALNPLYVDVHASCGATYGCMGTDGFYTAAIEALDDVNMSARKTIEAASVAVPDDVTSPVASISFANLAMDLPANPVSKLDNKNGNLFFAYTYSYVCGIAVGESFALPLSNISTGDINLEIGKFKLKKCEVTVEIENTIPLAVSIDNVRVLKPRASKEEEAVVDENIAVTSGITVAGGSLEKPAVTQLTIAIEALEGTIPDISEMLMDLNFAAQPDLGAVTLSAKQGLLVKSSSAKLSGGITIPLN
jgi:hypothetical protein